jgi:hypothetical protein
MTHLFPSKVAFGHHTVAIPWRMSCRTVETPSPRQLKSIHTAIAPRGLGKPGVPICRPTPAIDAKKGKSTNLPQVARGRSYL